MDKHVSSGRFSVLKDKMRQFDLFKQPIPQINLQGRQEVASWFGTLISIVIIALMCIYASLKFDLLIQRNNPNISKTEEIAALDESDVLNLGEAGLKFAFTAENFDFESMTDPRFVKFVVLLSTSSNGDYKDTPVMYHTCTETELREIASPTGEAEVVIEDIIATENRHLYCFDWKRDSDKLRVWGNWETYSYQYISVLLVPCNFVPEGYDELYPIADECIRDEKAQREYLKSYNLKIYGADQTFRQDKYGDSIIETRARFHS